MRLDKYLKVSRLIKRRTVANEACDRGKVMLNGKVAKAADRVKVGDVLTLKLGERELCVRVSSIAEHVKKDESAEMYEVI